MIGVLDRNGGQVCLALTTSVMAMRTKVNTSKNGQSESLVIGESFDTSFNRIINSLVQLLWIAKLDHEWYDQENQKWVPGQVNQPMHQKNPTNAIGQVVNVVPNTGVLQIVAEDARNVIFVKFPIAGGSESLTYASAYYHMN